MAIHPTRRLEVRVSSDARRRPGDGSDGAAEINAISQQIAADDSFNADQGVGAQDRIFVENTLGAEGDRGSECRARSGPLGSRRFMGHQADCYA